MGRPGDGAYLAAALGVGEGGAAGADAAGTGDGLGGIYGQLCDPRVLRGQTLG